MKKILLYIIAIIILCFCFASCDSSLKDKDDEADPDILKIIAVVDNIAVDGLPALFSTADDVGFERLWMSRENLPDFDFTPEFGQLVEIEVYIPSIQITDPRVAEAEIRKVTLIENPDIPVQYIRAGNLYDDFVWQKIIVIESVEQLNRYYTTGDFFDYAYYGMKSLREALSKYDDKFFEDNLLVFAVLVEGSGSFRHVLTGVDFKSSGNVINIKHINAGQNSDDMGVWHIIIEIKREDCKSDIFEINLF